MTQSGTSPEVSLRPFACTRPSGTRRRWRPAFWTACPRPLCRPPAGSPTRSSALCACSVSGTWSRARRNRGRQCRAGASCTRAASRHGQALTMPPFGTRCSAWCAMRICETCAGRRCWWNEKKRQRKEKYLGKKFLGIMRMFPRNKGLHNTRSGVQTHRASHPNSPPLKRQRLETKHRPSLTQFAAMATPHSNSVRGGKAAAHAAHMANQAMAKLGFVPGQKVVRTLSSPSLGAPVVCLVQVRVADAACACLCLRASLHARLHVSACVCICMRVCVCMRVCMCLRLYVSACRPMGTTSVPSFGRISRMACCTRAC